MKFKALGILAAVAIVVLSLAVLHWQFGSLANAIAYVDGQIVQVDQPIQQLGTIEPDKSIEVAFNLINLQREPLKIVGANVSCSCILPPQVPMTLQPFTTTPVIFNFTSSASDQQFEQEINLYFDGPLPAMQLKITGATR